MTNKSQAQLTQDCVSDDWANAIAEAERQIAAAEDRINGLKLSIQTFEEMRVRGEPFPGDSNLASQDAAA